MPRFGFSIDPDIRVARTLPARVYSDPDLFALRPAMPYEEVAAPMRDRLAFARFADLSFDAAGARDYLVNANWALYVDNYLEGFHIPYVHQSLSSTLEYGAYA